MYCVSIGRKKELDEALLNVIVKDLQTFSIMEDKGFKAFVRKLDPTYILPTRKALKTMVGEKYAEEEKECGTITDQTSCLLHC